MGAALSVQVMRGGQLISQHHFDSDTHRTIKIGRLPSAQLKIDDASVARIHAVIEFAGSDVSLIDMGSTVGTAVNGAKVHKVKLGHGDQVAIGDTQLVIGLGGAAQGVPAAAPAAAAPQPMPAAPAVAPVAWGAPASQPQPQPMPSGRAPSQPRFDPGNTQAEPIRRISKERLRTAAVESKPHPALPPEEVMTPDNRVLEMRLYWGEVLLGMNHYFRPEQITIGEIRKTDVFISSEGLPSERFPLIRFLGGQYMLTFTQQMDGEVELDGELVSLANLRGSNRVRRDPEMAGAQLVALPPSGRAVIHWGGATFALRFVPPPRTIPNTLFQNVDLHYINVLLLSVFFNIALVVTLLVYPYDTDSLRDDLFSKKDRFAELLLKPPEEKQSTKNLLEKIKKKIEQKQEEEAPQLKNAKVVPSKTPRPKKTEAQKQAEVKQKFSRMLAGVGGGGGSILGGGGGGSLAGTLSNVIGTAGAGSAGASLAGLGIRGGVLTGGGIGTSRGIAGIGTSGRLGGGGMAYGARFGIGNRKDRNLIGLSTPVVMGALPKEAIQKVINENKNQIRYCYETELQRKQDLEGKVSMKWIIAATGLVAQVAVTDTTLNNANVERCIAAKIKTWKFPQPAGGGIVEVNYPFVFRATG